MSRFAGPARYGMHGEDAMRWGGREGILVAMGGRHSLPGLPGLVLVMMPGGRKRGRRPEGKRIYLRQGAGFTEDLTHVVEVWGTAIMASSCWCASLAACGHRFRP